MTGSRSHYERLGIPRSADGQVLRKAFHRLSKDLHPDTTLLPIDEAANQFRELYESYALLSDPLRRRAYDQTLDSESFNSSKNKFGRDLNEKTLRKVTYDASPRRPFSGGEMFALFLLAFALLISLFIGVGFALFNGKELQVRPSWFQTEDSLNVITPFENLNFVTSSSYNTFKSALIRCS